MPIRRSCSPSHRRHPMTLRLTCTGSKKASSRLRLLPMPAYAQNRNQRDAARTLLPRAAMSERLISKTAAALNEAGAEIRSGVVNGVPITWVSDPIKFLRAFAADAIHLVISGDKGGGITKLGITCDNGQRKAATMLLFLCKRATTITQACQRSDKPAPPFLVTPLHSPTFGSCFNTSSTLKNAAFSRRRLVLPQRRAWRYGASGCIRLSNLYHASQRSRCIQMGTWQPSRSMGSRLPQPGTRASHQDQQ